MARRGGRQSYSNWREQEEERKSQYDAQVKESDRRVWNENMMAGGKWLAGEALTARKKNIERSSKKLNMITGSEPIGNIPAMTNLYTEKQGILGKITGNYTEQNPEIIQNTDQLSRENQQTQMTDIYGSTAAQAYDDSTWTQDRTQVHSFADNMPEYKAGMYEGTDPTMDYSSLDGSGITPYQYDQQVLRAQGQTGVGVRDTFGTGRKDAFAFSSHKLRDFNLDDVGPDVDFMSNEEKYNYIDEASKRGEVEIQDVNVTLPDGTTKTIAGSAAGTRNQLMSNNEDVKEHIRKKNLAAAESLSAVDGVPSLRDTGVNPRKRLLADDAFTGFTEDSTSQDLIDELGRIETDRSSAGYGSVEQGLKGQYDDSQAIKKKTAADAIEKQRRANADLRDNSDHLRSLDTSTNVTPANAGPPVVMPDTQDQEKYLNKVGGYYDQQQTKKNLEIYKTEQARLNADNAVIGTGVELPEDMSGIKTAKRKLLESQKRDAYNKKHGIGKYSDPNIPIESDDFGENEIGSLVESRDDLADLGIDSLSTAEEMPVANVSETVSNIQSNTQEDLANKAAANTKVDLKGIKETAGDAYSIGKNVKGLTSDDEDTQIQSGANIASTVTDKVVKKESAKFIKKKTEEIAARKLEDVAAKKLTEEAVKTASTTGGTALGTAAKGLGGGAAAVTGFYAAGEGVKGYKDAAERGDVDEAIAQGVQATGGAVAGAGGVLTGVGAILTATGVGAVIGAPMMAIGGTMTTYGGIAATAGSMYTMAENAVETKPSGRKSNYEGSSKKRVSRSRNYGRA